MCGHVGIAGTIGHIESKTFRNLLIMDAIRGIDGTGVAIIDSKNVEPTIIKDVGHPFNIIGTESWYNHFEKITDKQVLIGHNRFTTVGENIVDNTHPFDFPNLVGAHNGTLHNFHQLKHSRNLQATIDSQCIFEMLSDSMDILINNKQKISSWSPQKTINELSGAYALVWFDKWTNSINLLRNSQRPLYYVYSALKDCILWSSDVNILWTAALHSGLQFDNKPVELPVDVWHKFVLPDYGQKFLEAPIKIPCAKQYMSVSNHIYGYTGTNYYSKSNNYAYSHNRRRSGYTSSNTTSSGDNVLLLPPRINRDSVTVSTLVPPTTEEEVVAFSAVDGVRPKHLKYLARFVMNTNMTWDRLSKSAKSRFGFYIKKWEDDADAEPNPIIAWVYDVHKASIHHIFHGPIEDYITELVLKADVTEYPAEDTNKVATFTTKTDTIDDPVTGYNGVRLTRAAFFRALNSGCSGCGVSGLEEKEAEEVTWISYGQYLCKSCAKEYGHITCN